MKKERLWMRAYADRGGHSSGDYGHCKKPFAIVDMKDRVTFFASEEIEDFE